MATKLVKEKQKIVAITHLYRDAWSMMVTLVGIKQLLLQISNLSVTHVNLLLKLHYLGLHSTITFIRLQHTVTDTGWAKTWKYIHIHIKCYHVVRCYGWYKVGLHTPLRRTDVSSL